MVTGIETAGLALAIFPLLVQGLKFYADGCRIIGDWRNYQLVLKEFVRELKMEKCKFENTCLLLLEDMVLPEGISIENLMDDPGGPFWEAPKILESLKKRLRDGSVSPYLQAISALGENLKSLEVQFGLDLHSCGVPDKKLQKRHWKRIKVALRKDDYKNSLKNIQSLNFDLATLTGQCRPIEKAVDAEKTLLTAKFYTQIREHSVDLHDVFRDKLQHTPTHVCSVPHNVSLQLEARGQDTISGEGKELRFKVLFSFDCSPVTPSVARNWREIEFEIGPIEKEVSESALGQHVRHNTTYPVVAIPDKLERKSGFFLRLNDKFRRFATSTPEKPGKVVGRAVSAITGSALAPLDSQPEYKKKRSSRGESLSGKSNRTVSFNVPLDHSHQQTTSAPSSEIPKVEDLCSTIKCITEDTKCIGFLIGKTNRRHLIWPANTPASQEYTTEALSLEDVITNYLELFKRIERLRLGVKLASAVMQLHNTEWLSERWGKRNIYFLLKRQCEKSGQSTPVFNKPFVRRKFDPSQGASTFEPRSSEAALINYNKTVFSLGIVLVELWHGVVLQTVSPKQYEAEAKKRIDEIIEHNDAGARYGNAVRRCIRGLDHKSVDLNEEDFKNMVHQKVVVPLEKNLRIFDSGK